MTSLNEDRNTCRIAMALLMVMSLGFSACEEEEPPPPSDPPVLSGAEVTCGKPTEAQIAAAYEGYDLDVVQTVSVEIDDPQRDLLDDSVHGEINGLPIASLTDDDADLRYVWTAPTDEAPIACQGEIVLRFWAADLDGNTADLTEIISK